MRRNHLRFLCYRPQRQRTLFYPNGTWRRHPPTHFDPSRKGLQVWDCHENKRDGSTYRDAATGEVLLQIKSNTDVGRCMVPPTLTRLIRVWKCGRGDSQGIRNVKGEIIAPKMRNMPTNMAVWWDGDLLCELLDRNMIIKYDWENKSLFRLSNSQELFSTMERNRILVYKVTL